MGHIKEPDGVDFIINGKPLTIKERKSISEFIKADKQKIAKQKLRRMQSAKKKKLVTSKSKLIPKHIEPTTDL